MTDRRPACAVGQIVGYLHPGIDASWCVQHALIAVVDTAVRGEGLLAELVPMPGATAGALRCITCGDQLDGTGLTLDAWDVVARLQRGDDLPQPVTGGDRQLLGWALLLTGAR